ARNPTLAKCNKNNAYRQAVRLRQHHKRKNRFRRFFQIQRADQKQQRPARLAAICAHDPQPPAQARLLKGDNECIDTDALVARAAQPLRTVRNGTSRSSSTSFGKPSTRSPMMLRWIWSVPPPIEVM